MKDKILRIIGFVLVGYAPLMLIASLILPEASFDKLFTVFILTASPLSLAALIIMISKESEAESMKCPACGREVDALIGRQNDPETKICADCYIGEDLKEGK